MLLDDPVRPYALHRRVFADDGPARFDQRLGAERELIRTVSGRGYQFTGEIRALPASPDAGADAEVKVSVRVVGAFPCCSAAALKNSPAIPLQFPCSAA
jgi:hypothetical protein